MFKKMIVYFTILCMFCGMAPMPVSAAETGEEMCLEDVLQSDSVSDGSGPGPESESDTVSGNEVSLESDTCLDTVQADSSTIQPETFAAEGQGTVLYSGEESGVTWEITSDGVLNISGEKTAGMPNPRVAKWIRLYKGKFSKIVVTAKNIDSTAGWFDCSNSLDVGIEGDFIKEIDLSAFDASQVTDMSKMFSQCSGLTSLDLSGLDTSQVTNMNGMFSGCSSLAGLNLSGFNTENVTNMENMFYACGSLTSLDLSGLDMSQNTNMKNMFYNCRGLTSLNLSGLDTGNVTDMSLMFWGCRSLTNLDLSSWNTENVKDMSHMFGEAQNLTGLDMSGWDIGNAVNMQGMFYYCNSLRSVDLSSWVMGEATNTDKMFDQCSLTKIKTFSNLQSDIELPTGIRYDKDGNRYTAFPPNLPEGIWLYAKTIYEGDESGIAWYITYDGVLTISGEKPEGEPDPDSSAWRAYKDEFRKAVVTVKNIESAAGWFEDCERLEEVDLSGFDTGKLVKADDMFKNCNSITWIKTFPNLQLQIALPLPVMYDEYRNEYKTYFPTALAEGIYLYADADNNVRFSGTESGIAWKITSDGVLTISGEKLAGEPNPDGSAWRAHKGEFTKVVVTAKNVESTANWFEDCSGITEIDLTAFDTVQVTDMSYMFEGCSGLTSLDVSGFETAQVTNMRGMFKDCIGLTSLDMSGLDISQVTDMENMFYNCQELTSLDMTGLRGVDTGNIKNMQRMFWKCRSLTNLDLSDWNTENVINMNYMFAWAENLKSLNMSGWDIGNAKYMQAMFWNCLSLRSIDLSSWVMGEATNTEEMFYSCHLTKIKTFSNLKVDIELPKVTSQEMYDKQGNRYTAFPKDLPEGIWLYASIVYYGDDESGIVWYTTYDGTLTISGEKTEGEPDPDGSAWKEYKDEFRKAVVTAKNIESAAGWFEDCEKLEEVDLSGFDTGKLMNADNMFKGCSGIMRLQTFPNLQLPIALPLETMYDRDGGEYHEFPLLSESVELYGKNGIWYSGTESGITWEITYGGVLTIAGEKTAVEPNPDGSAWKAYKDKFTKAVVTAKNVESASGWFEDCDRLTEVDLSGFDTSQVTDMGRMFYGCSGLTSLDLSGWDMGKVTNAEEMFENCAGIVQIRTFPNLQLQIALPFTAMYDENDQAYEYFPTGLEQGIMLYRERQGSGEEPEQPDIPQEPGTPEQPDVPEEPDIPVPPADKEGMHVELVQKGGYVYTGSAVKPAIRVYNHGELLAEGTDYTVKYSGNKKVSTAKSKAKITVTGKGNLSGSVSTTFDILPKNIGDDDVTVGNIMIAEGSKPAPVLVYNNAKLTARDYTLGIRGEDGELTAVSRFTEDGKLVVTGRGNYTGEMEVDVTVRAKSELKKFTVIPGKEKLTYNGKEQKISFTVKDTKSGEDLKPDEDYIVLYPENITDAGAIKFTVVGMGEYSGSVTKSYKIKPLAAAAGAMKISGVKESGYTFKSGGVTIGEDLTVTCSTESGDIVLTEGRDYKLTYKNNKKVSSTDSRAKYTVTFMGSYKGTKAVKGEFLINALPLSQEMDGLKAALADKVYTGRAGTYISRPYVTLDGVALKASDYTVKYYKTAERKDGEEISSRNKLALASEDSEATIYVKIIGKGNYAPAPGDTETYLEAEYKVRRTSAETGREVYDLSKAKVTFYKDEECTQKVTKLEYTGKEVEPFVKVECREGNKYVTLERDVDYKVTYMNNVNKGKAAVIITGVNARYAGSRTASFSIAAKNLKKVVDFFEDLFKS